METNKYIDHTLLRADAAYDEIEALCAEAKEYDFASICVSSYWVLTCAELLKGADVKVYTVTGFLLGAMGAKTKAFKTAAAIADGAKEISMVLNVKEMRAGHYDAVRTDIKAIVGAAGGNYVEAILGDYLLIEEEIVKVYGLCMEVGAALAKTLTGFLASGATPEDVKLVKDTVKGRCLMKTAGGVRCHEDMEKIVEVRTDRISTSAGVKLVRKETSDGRY